MRMPRIGNISELEKSKWYRSVSDPEILEGLTKTVERWLGKVGKKNPTAQRAKLALEMFRQGRSGEFLSARNILILGASLLYTISPLDAIPDVIPVIGWLDDMGVLAMAISAITPVFMARKELPTLQNELEEENRRIQEEQSCSMPEIRTNFASWACEDDDLQILIKEAHSYGNSELASAADDVKLLAEDPLQRIVFAGTFNSGKSSLINRLLNQDLLPTEPIPTTPALTSIIHGDVTDVVVRYTNGSYYSSTDINELKSQTCRKDVDEIVVRLPHQFLKNGVTVVDTAGLQDAEHAALNYDELPQALCLVFVKDMIVGSLDRDEQMFLEKVRASLNTAQLIVVLNKADRVSLANQSKIRRDIEEQLYKIGITDVKIYTTCAAMNERESYQLQEFVAEILQRADNQFSSLACANIERAKVYLRELCSAEKEKQLQLRKLGKAEQEKLAKQLEEKCVQMEGRFSRRADILKAEFRADLHNFLKERLLPEICKIVDDSPVDAETGNKIGEATRATLLQYLDNASKNIFCHYNISVDELMCAEVKLPIGGFSVPVDIHSYKQMTDACKFLLPTVMVATFPFMGIVGWLTNIVVPSLILDKLGISDIVANFGPTRGAREKIMDGYRASLVGLENKVCEQVGKFIDECSQKRLRNERLNLSFQE